MQWMMMPLKRYADFSGRSRRMEYWMWQVFKCLVGFVFIVLFSVIFGAVFASYGATKDPSQLIAAGGGVLILWMIYMIFALAILIPDIAVTVRRLHDTNRTGWWILAPVIPYIFGMIAMVVTVGAGAGMQQGDKIDTGALATGGIIGMISILVTAALGITLLVFLFMEGTVGPNKYGPDPKERNAGQVFS